MNIIASRIIASLGILLSSYAVYVEHKINNDPSYNPVCEIGANASCKAALTSEYGKILGVSNAILGIFAYISYLVMSFIIPQYLIYVAIIAVISSIILASISYFKMRNICIICTTIYVLNILLLVFVF